VSRENSPWETAINQAGSQRFFLAGTTLALEESTQKASGCIGFFLVMDGERHEIHTL